MTAGFLVLRGDMFVMFLASKCILSFLIYCCLLLNESPLQLSQLYVY